MDSKDKDCNRVNSTETIVDFSNYIVSFINSGINLTFTDDVKETNKSEEDCSNDVHHLNLTSQVKLKEQEDRNDSIQKITFPEILRSKNYSNQAELAAICQEICLTPERIMSQKDVFPTPHPKNLRYVDHYRVRERLSNGRVILQPISDKLSKNTNKSLNKDIKIELVKQETAIGPRKQKRKRATKKKKVIDSDKDIVSE